MLLDTGRERAGGKDARRLPSWRNVGGGLVMTVAALVAGAATAEAEPAGSACAAIYLEHLVRAREAAARGDQAGVLSELRAAEEAERLCLEAPRKRNAEEPARPHLLSGLPSSGIRAG